MTNYVCRICLRDSTDGLSLGEQHKDYKLYVVFEDLTGIKVELNVDDFPSKICYECLEKLYSAYETRRLCIASDAYLRNQVQGESINKSEDEVIQHLDNHEVDIKWDDDDIQDGLNLLEIDLDETRNVLDDVQPAEEDYCSNNESCINPTPTSTLKRLQSHICPTCDRSFQCEATLKKHIFTHNKVSNCPLCLKTFSNTSNLKRHIATHNDKVQLNCDKCDKKFTETTVLFEHLKIHRFDGAEKRDEFLLECEICEEKTVSFASYYKHMKINHNIEGKVKAFKCRICKMRFASKQGLYRHIDNIHENNRQNLRNRDKNFLCNECGKSFFTNFHLTTHARSHSGAKPFSCTYCKKSFSQSSGLKTHTLTHLNIRPFSCKVCFKTFTQLGHVREHLLTHTDDRPYTCKICNHSFRVKGNLSAHMLIHLGKKPHVCDHCGNRFNQSTHLRQHIIKKHKINIDRMQGG